MLELGRIEGKDIEWHLRREKTRLELEFEKANEESSEILEYIYTLALSCMSCSIEDYSKADQPSRLAWRDNLNIIMRHSPDGNT